MIQGSRLSDRPAAVDTVILRCRANLGGSCSASYSVSSWGCRSSDCRHLASAHACCLRASWPCSSGPRRDGAAVRRLFTCAQRYTAFQERHSRENAQCDLGQGKGTIAARSGLQVADYYASLVRKYRLTDVASVDSRRLRAPVVLPRRPTSLRRSLSDRPTTGNPPERAAENSVRPADGSSGRQESVPRRQRLSATRGPGPGKPPSITRAFSPCSGLEAVVTAAGGYPAWHLLHFSATGGV